GPRRPRNGTVSSSQSKCNWQAARAVYRVILLLASNTERGHRDVLPARRVHPVTPGLFVVVAVIAVGAFILLVVLAARAAKARDRRYRSGLLDWATARGWAYRDGGGGE